MRVSRTRPEISCISFARSDECAAAVAASWNFSSPTTPRSPDSTSPAVIAIAASMASSAASDEAPNGARARMAVLSRKRLLLPLGMACIAMGLAAVRDRAAKWRCRRWASVAARGPGDPTVHANRASVTSVIMVASQCENDRDEYGGQESAQCSSCRSRTHRHGRHDHESRSPRRQASACRDGAAQVRAAAKTVGAQGFR